MRQVIWCALPKVALCLLFIVSFCHAFPATSTSATTYIVSYVDQRKTTKTPAGAHKEFEEFDFENLSATNPEMKGALQQLFGRFVQNLETNLDIVDKNLAPRNGALKISEVRDNEIPDTDDLQMQQANTLDGVVGDSEQHESQINETMWHRSKQSIPVLESVRHLVHSVRNGALNNTEHANPMRHHQLLNGGDMMTMLLPAEGSNDSSPAIETEEEREMINHGQNLQGLEILGSIGSMIWRFLSSLKQVFAASSGSASAALSAQSSSTSS